MRKNIITLINCLCKYKNANVNFLCEENNITRRQLLYRIDNINELLNKENLSLIYIKGNTCFLNKECINFLNKYLINIKKDRVYEYSSHERVAIIFILILLQKDYIDISCLISVIKASRSSINNSLKDLKKDLNNHNLDIIFTRQKGYQLIGSEIDIRNYLMMIISNLLIVDNISICLDRIIQTYNLDTYSHVCLIIEELANKYHIKYVGDRISELIYNLIFLKQRMLCQNIQNDLLNGQQNKISTNSKEYLFVTELFSILNIPIYNHEHIYYICAWMMGISIGDYEEYSSDRVLLTEIIQKIMDRFELLSACNYENKNEIFRQLYAHFRPAYYRMIFNIPINNPLKDKIKLEYNNLYFIVKDSLKPLESIFGDKLSDDEIAFLTIHFASIYSNENKVQIINKPKAIIVSSNGVASSALLYSELTNLLPQLEILSPIDYYTFKSVQPEVDIVFSTSLLVNDLKNDNKVILVSVLMDETEKFRVISEVDYILKNKLNGYVSIIDRLFNEIKSSAIIQDEKELRQKIFNVLYNKDNYKFNDNNQILTLPKILVEDNIIFSSKKLTSIEAVKLSAKPLLINGFIEKTYVESLLSNDLDYYVIAPNIAFPHVNLVNSVIKIGLSLLVLDYPVDFGFHKGIKHIFTLCAIDQTSHMYAMRQLLDLWNDSKFFEILKSKDSYLVYKYIVSVLEHKN